jgi:hypothetical protein
VAEALRAGGAVADFLNSPAAAGLDGAACGEVLTALGEIQGKLSSFWAASFSSSIVSSFIVRDLSAPGRNVTSTSVSPELGQDWTLTRGASR